MRGFPTVVLLNSQWPLSFQVFDFFFLFSDSQGSTLLVILLGRLDDNKGKFDGAHSLLSSLLWQKKKTVPWLSNSLLSSWSDTSCKLLVYSLRNRLLAAKRRSWTSPLHGSKPCSLVSLTCLSSYSFEIHFQIARRSVHWLRPWNPIIDSREQQNVPRLSFTMDTQPQELVLQLCWDNQWVTWQHRGPIEAHFPLAPFLFLLFSASVLSSLHLSRDCSQINWFDSIAVFDNMRKPMESVNTSAIIQRVFAAFIHSPA